MIQLPTLIPPYCGRSEATERKDYLFASPKMSFGFHVARDHAEDRDYTRVIDRIDKVYDVSAVSLLANDNTEISVSTRDFFRAVAERRKQTVLSLQRRKLQLRMKAGY